MPSVVCVRSFVPKEKKSAYSAISPARSAARGSSIIVPHVYSISGASSAITCSVSARSRRRQQELMQRRIEQPYGPREPRHRLEDLLEVGLLERQQPVERLAAAR